MSELSSRQDQQKELIIDQLKKTPIVQLVCEKIGVSRATFYRWKKDDLKFGMEAEDALLSGKLLVNDMAESQLISAIKEKNMTAIIFWLKHHHKDYRNQIDISAEITAKEVLSAEQQESIIQALTMVLSPFPNTITPKDNDAE